LIKHASIRKQIVFPIHVLLNLNLALGCQFYVTESVALSQQNKEGIPLDIQLHVVYWIQDQNFMLVVACSVHMQHICIMPEFNLWSTPSAFYSLVCVCFALFPQYAHPRFSSLPFISGNFHHLLFSAHSPSLSFSLRIYRTLTRLLLLRSVCTVDLHLLLTPNRCAYT